MPKIKGRGIISGVHTGGGNLGGQFSIFSTTLSSVPLLCSGDHPGLFSVVADIYCKLCAESCASTIDRTEYRVGKTANEIKCYSAIVLN